VGSGAIRVLASETKLPIEVVPQTGEQIPFAAEYFDAIHARQVLHHASDLDAMSREIARVLRSGGLLLSTREHVADDEQQLAAFRDSHPLHRFYGGENAYPLARYLAVFANAGLQVLAVWGPLQSILNFYPGTERERQVSLRNVANHSYLRLGRLLAWSGSFREAQVRRHTQRDRLPGRIYSFLIQKP
jgi:SAM-dependent methyltransferase